jgi:hypothetical protein
MKWFEFHLSRLLPFIVRESRDDPVKQFWSAVTLCLGMKTTFHERKYRAANAERK